MSTHVPSKPRPVVQAQAKGEQVARSTSFEWLARSGFVARGVIYALIGILAIKLATGGAGHQASQQGALKAIAAQPFGKVLLILVAIGLAGYALWRFIRAILGHGPEGSDDTFDRLSALVSGIVYSVLCALSVQIVLGSGGGSSSNTHKQAAGIFGWPGGPWIVGFIGAALVGVGLYQGYKGVTKSFLKDSKTEEMSPAVRTWIEWIGTFGHLARMVVTCLVGVFLIKSAVEFDPKKAVGLDGALAKLAAASYGPFMLGLVAAGLIAFGVYSLSDARYRRI